MRAEPKSKLEQEMGRPPDRQVRFAYQRHGALPSYYIEGALRDRGFTVSLVSGSVVMAWPSEILDDPDGMVEIYRQWVSPAPVPTE